MASSLFSILVKRCSLDTVKVLVAFKLAGRKEYDFKGDLNLLANFMEDLRQLAQMSLDAKQHEAFLLTRNFAAGTHGRYINIPSMQ
jgi:hypothetical protein